MIPNLPHSKQNNITYMTLQQRCMPRFSLLRASTAANMNYWIICVLKNTTRSSTTLPGSAQRLLAALVGGTPVR